ncbi:MAG TPA: TIGR03435 family protein, partial [Chloroflexota bacterium]
KDKPTIRATVFFNGGYQVSRVRMQLEPLSVLTRLFPRQDDLPVVDKTGLTGTYTFNLEYAWAVPNAEAASVEPAPPVAEALKQQLGLDLVRAKLPFDVVIVDSVNLSPTEN